MEYVKTILTGIRDWLAGTIARAGRLVNAAQDGINQHVFVSLSAPDHLLMTGAVVLFLGVTVTAVIDKSVFAGIVAGALGAGVLILAVVRAHLQTKAHIAAQTKPPGT